MVTARSTLLPGWDNLPKKKFPHNSISIALIGLTSLVTNENKKHQDAVNQYNSLSNPILLGGLILNSSEAPPHQENTFLLFYSQSSNANNSYVASSRNFSFAFLGVYLLNIIDAYFFYSESILQKDFLIIVGKQMYGQMHINRLNYRVDQTYMIGYTVRY